MDGVMFDWSLMHPACRENFNRFAQQLLNAYQRADLKDRWEPWEGWRSPQRSFVLNQTGRSIYPPWTDPHNYGMAITFRPRVGVQWSFEEAGHDYEALDRWVTGRGLLWRGHGVAVHPLYEQVRRHWLQPSTG